MMTLRFNSIPITEEEEEEEEEGKFPFPSHFSSLSFVSHEYWCIGRRGRRVKHGGEGI